MYGVVRFKKAFYKYSNRFISRWLILLIDLVITAFTFLVAYNFVFEFDPKKIQYHHFGYEVPMVMVFYLVSFLLTKSYVGVIRHTSLADGVRLAMATFCALFGLLVADVLFKGVGSSPIHPAYVPIPVLVMHALLTVFLLFMLRLLFKAVYVRLVSGASPTKRVLIYGAGSAGITTMNSLKSNSGVTKYKIIGFLDDNETKINKTIYGHNVYSPNQDLQELIEDFKIDEVIFTIQNVSKQRKRTIVTELLKYDIETKIIPPIEQWMNGELQSEQIQNVKIEDLLGRDEITLDIENIGRTINGKNILITGGAGSIGSEIVRQLTKFGPGALVILDQSETGVFEIENELKALNIDPTIQIIPTIADVSQIERLRQVFEAQSIDIVFHAAAYKHVPMMEKNPTEAITCNVKGTKNLADLAVEFEVEKFVMISTDKAVNPTNVMGASKRLAEIYVQTLNEHQKELGNSQTKFITTRFGNVLGSNGSVIPIFKRQIENGGPVKVTHPEITRYFMTIPEACQLVLEAGAMGEGGEIFIFDMGESVKILDLAHRMIRLSGLKPNVDINIEFTGLREGEKLYEELLSSSEKTTPTHHQKIMIAKVRKENFEEVSTGLNELFRAANTKDTMELVRKMKQLIPEYISKNSVYQKLDLE